MEMSYGKYFFYVSLSLNGICWFFYFVMMQN